RVIHQWREGGIVPRCASAPEDDKPLPLQPRVRTNLSVLAARHADLHLDLPSCATKHSLHDKRLRKARFIAQHVTTEAGPGPCQQLLVRLVPLSYHSRTPSVKPGSNDAIGQRHECQPGQNEQYGDTMHGP